MKGFYPPIEIVSIVIAIIYELTQGVDPDHKLTAED